MRTRLWKPLKFTYIYSFEWFDGLSLFHRS